MEPSFFFLQKKGSRRMDVIEKLRDLIFYLGLMSPACFESLVINLNFSDAVCLKSAVSKTLGLGIVVGSSLVKVPQVLKIMASGSAEGISFMSILLELIAITFSGVYGFSNNFPFSAYGESLFLALQTGIIALLVLSFSKGKLSALLFLSIYAGKYCSKYFIFWSPPTSLSFSRCCLGPDEPPHHSD